MEAKVRLSIKALIIKDENLLCIKHIKNNEVYYGLPGGGQNFGETVEEAIKRECLEEAGLEVNPLQVAFVRDYIGKHHQFAKDSSDHHQVEIVFYCEALSEPKASLRSEMDTHQVDIEWLPLKALSELNIFPSIYRTKINEFLKYKNFGLYLGDVN